MINLISKKNTLITSILICFFLVIFLFAKANNTTFVLKNGATFDRINDVVEVSVDGIGDFSGLAPYDETGIVLPSQKLENAKVRFQVNIEKESTATYTLKPGTSLTLTKKTHVAQKESLSRNDIAGENDLNAYRMCSKFSHELNTANGVDIWCNKMLEPIIETSMVNLPQKSHVLDVIRKANDYWQTNNPTHGNSFWNRAAYHTGNMAAYEVTKDQIYYDYSVAWAEQNNWKGASSTNKSEWKYASYGEGQDYVLFGDWQICFQVYIDLYNISPLDSKVARAKEVMDYQISTSTTDYWWWADGLYMVMPVMTRMYKLTGNSLYLEKLYTYWQYANSIMYDGDEGIYFRDGKYVYPTHKTSNGKKDFWSRGNGWVFAAFARVLADLPKDNQYRDTYISYYRRMAAKLKELQMPEGYWSRSLMDANYASGYETSGTAFFTYGYLWGINNGYLSEKEYGATVEKAWKYLTTIALQESGKVGYVQPIGENAAQHNVSAETTADFGVGAFLLAASEMYKYVAGDDNEPTSRLTTMQVQQMEHVKSVFSDEQEAVPAQNSDNYIIVNGTTSGH